MEIKIATWNMAYWQHKAYLEDAWQYFVNEIDADFFLFQEARPSKEIQNDKSHFIWNEIGGTRPWGSGVYSKKYKLSEEVINTHLKGTFTVANAEIDNIKLTLISLYGLMTDTYSITNLHRILSDLTLLFDGKVGGKRNVILGGDLNASTQFDSIQNKSHEIFFNRLEDFNLQNAYKLSGNKSHVQTLRFAGSNIPWQNDYFFISKPIAKGFKSYNIIDDDSVRIYSDHNILVITLDL